MRTNIRTLVTLNTFLAVPYRYIDCDSTFFIFRCTIWHSSIRKICKTADWNIVAFHGVNRDLDLTDPLRQIFIHFALRYFNIRPCLRNFNFFNQLNSFVYGCVIHIYDLFAFSSVGFEDRTFHVFHCFINRNDSCDLEECGLKNRVCSASKSKLLCDCYRIDNIKMDLLLGCCFLKCRCEVFVQFFTLPVTGDQNISTFFYICENVIFIQVGFVMTGYKIRMIYKVCGFNRLFSESQVRTCNTAGFLSVIFKISLYIEVCMITNDLDGIFVCTNSTVRAKSPEFTAYSSFRCGIDGFCYRQGQMCNIIFDSDCEVIFRCVLLHVFIDSCYM